MKRFRKDGWTEEHIGYLREIAADRTNTEITEMFNKKFNQNRTVNSIIGVKSRYGIYSYTKVYTKEELEYLREIKTGKTRKEITELFNKKFNADRTVGSIKSVMQENGMRLDSDGRFKKGNRPENIQPVGTEVMRGDGYLWVKVAEPNKWKLKHRVIYQEHHGAIPEGGRIVFGDGDALNLDIDNLILVSDKQLLKMNQFNLIQNDAELTKTGVLIADLYLKMGEKKRKIKGGQQ